MEVSVARQVLALGKEGDALVAISTSGNSPNILKAVAAAKKLKIITIGFSGYSGGQLKEEVDFCLTTPATRVNYIQEMHIACGHILCQIVEETLFPK